ncbi:MAG: T9SS type A sorting domain-containing protein [Ignavibacteriaceae bacterium]|nr:T9SS type A sorting domain-containing protein [Ignavibacteriaceae bacterium]
MVCVSGTTNGGVWIFTDTQIPVELSVFRATLNNGIVKLNWETATELNNSGFKIERSNSNSEIGTENLIFEPIGYVPGFGTSTEHHFYSFIDENIDEGTYYYRLKQIDFDGSFKYSEIIEVDVVQTFSFNLEQNYPNPFNPSTKIQYQIPVGGFVSLIVYDVLGNEIATLVQEEKSAGEYEVEFNVGQTISLSNGVSAKGGYASGVYFYTLIAGDFVQTKRMVLLR